jgi:hypothetical protein
MEQIIHSACFWGIILCGALSLLPLRFSRRWKSWPLYLPIVGIGLFILFESQWMTIKNIQSDRMILIPVLLFLCVNGMMKVGLLQVMVAWTGDNSSQLLALPQRRLQAAFSSLILAGGVLLI